MITAIHACGFNVLDTVPDIEVHRCRFPTGEQYFVLRKIPPQILKYTQET